MDLGVHAVCFPSKTYGDGGYAVYLDAEIQGGSLSRTVKGPVAAKGSGVFTAGDLPWSFPLTAVRPGLSVALLNADPKEPTQASFAFQSGRVEVVLLLCGAVSLETASGECWSSREGGGAFLLDATGGTLGRLRVEPGPLRGVVVSLEPETLPRLFCTDGIPNVFLRAAASQLSSFQCSAAIKVCLRQMLGDSMPSGLKSIFLESKTLELLYLLADQCGGESNEALEISKADKRCLREARSILNANLVDPPSLAELSRQCGLNEYKLKKNFKALYGTTVYGHVNEQRMELAREFLAEGRMNVNEAGWAVGYSNVSHFIAAFRKRFGISPGAFKREARSMGMAI